MAQFIKGKQIAKQSVTINGVDGNVIAQGNLDMLGNAVIINSVPTSDFEAANKAYVDSLAQGLRPHAPVYVTSTAQIESGNIPSGVSYTIDGLSISVDDRVLLTNQGGTGVADSHIYNGLWQVQAGGWIRPDDADGTPENEVALGDFVYTTSGTTEASSGWVLAGTDANDDGWIIPNVEAQKWVKMAAPGSYTTDGQGLELSGNQFYLELDGTTLSKSATGLKLSDTVSSAISSNTDDITSLSTALSTETTERVSGDNSLSTSIDTETSLRVSGDGSLSTALSGEISERISGDSSLSTLVSSNTSGNVSLSTALSAETSERISGDSSLSTLVSSNASGNVSLSTALSGEISERISADSSLSTLISSGGAGVESLSTVVSTETSDRISADSSLSTLISSNTSDNVSLSTALSVEISERISGDSSLSTLVSSNASDNVSLSTALSGEISERVSADTSLSTLVSSNTSSNVSLSTALSGEISERISGDNSLSTLVSSNTSSNVSLSTALSTETSERISADTSLSSAIANIAAPAYAEKNITPANSGDTTAVVVDAAAFPQLATGETVEEASVMVYMNGLVYAFEWAQGTPAVFHTNNTQPSDASATGLYFDGQVAGFPIETDDVVKLKYVVSS